MNRTEAYELILESAETHKHSLKGRERRQLDRALVQFRKVASRYRARLDYLRRRRQNPEGLCGLKP